MRMARCEGCGDRWCRVYRLRDGWGCISCYKRSWRCPCGFNGNSYWTWLRDPLHFVNCLVYLIKR